MYLVQFSDGATTFLFPDELAFEDASFAEGAIVIPMQKTKLSL
jgi:hypothetical protein